MFATNPLTGQPKCLSFYLASLTNDLIIQMKFFVASFYLTIFAFTLLNRYSYDNYAT